MKNVTENKQTLKKAEFFGGGWDYTATGQWQSSGEAKEIGLQMRRSTAGEASGAGNWHKGSRSPGTVLQGGQAGCTCRLVPPKGSWVGCKDGFGKELEYFSPTVQQPRRDPSLASPSLGVPRVTDLWAVQVDFPKPERGQ